jgi:hypothetical protein
MAIIPNALKGQKNYAFALSGRWMYTPYTQGVALGYRDFGLSGRFGE